MEINRKQTLLIIDAKKRTYKAKVNRFMPKFKDIDSISNLGWSGFLLSEAFKLVLSKLTKDHHPITKFPKGGVKN